MRVSPLPRAPQLYCHIGGSVLTRKQRPKKNDISKKNSEKKFYLKKDLQLKASFSEPILPKITYLKELTYIFLRAHLSYLKELSYRFPKKQLTCIFLRAHLSYNLPKGITQNNLVTNPHFLTPITNPH